MKQLKLLRYPTPRGVFGTFSELFLDGEFVCYTVEKEWRNNEKSVSCVPIGTYNLIPHDSNSFGDCYALECESLGVTRYGPSQRTHILIHAANSASQLEGCIAPGEQLGVVGNEWSVINSRTAFIRLMKMLNGENATLEIVNA